MTLLVGLARFGHKSQLKEMVMRWNLQKINLGGKTTCPAAVGDPFVSVYDGQQHIAYRGSGGAIWDAWYLNGGWNRQQINLGGNTTGKAATRAPFVGVYGNQQRFVYVWE
jgi:hypothetical protein